MKIFKGIFASKIADEVPEEEPMWPTAIGMGNMDTPGPQVLLIVLNRWWEESEEQATRRQ